jgi:hypothetical protein
VHVPDALCVAIFGEATELGAIVADQLAQVKAVRAVSLETLPLEAELVEDDDDVSSRLGIGEAHEAEVCVLVHDENGEFVALAEGRHLHRTDEIDADDLSGSRRNPIARGVREAMNLGHGALRAGCSKRLESHLDHRLVTKLRVL